MDPDNLRRGPRRAHRRGEAAIGDGPADISATSPQEGAGTDQFLHRSLQITDTVLSRALEQSPRAREYVADSDDEEGIQALARDLEGPLARDPRNPFAYDMDVETLAEQMETARDHQSDEDDADADDVLDGQYADMIDEPSDEFEYENRGEANDQIPASIFDPVVLGLKEINNLAHFSVSSHKPGNGVQELLNDDLDKYWQSDGQQPHFLTIHFLRRVEIRAVRFYVDYNQDESYTPTFVVFSAGTGHHDLIEFATMPLANPVGWQDVDLSDVGGGEDGRSLCCYIIQMQIKENHQNGKDTHIRGLKIYALDENFSGNAQDDVLDELSNLIDDAAERLRVKGLDADETELQRLLYTPRSPRRPGSSRPGIGGLGIPDFMRDPEIR